MKIRLLVNAIPLTNVHTGISRYLTCLYQQLECLYADELEIGYFDGTSVLSTMPVGPSSVSRWSSLVRMFWKLPPHVALGVRLAMQARRERAFAHVAKGFDVYHEAGFFPFAHASRMKTVFTLHDCSIFRYPQFHPKERVLFAKRYFENRLRMVDHTLCVSDFSRQEARSFFNVPSESMTVTHLAHSEAFCETPSQDAVVHVRKEYDLPNQYYLFVGGGDPRKNLMPLLAAMEQANIDVPLVVVGWSGWAESDIRNGVMSIGHVSDRALAGLYAGAQALLYPSQYEGFGLPVLEAMSMGCPVVALREASLPEVGGDAALYLNTISAQEVRAATDRLADPAFRAGVVSAGKQQAAMFSWEQTARKTFSVVESVLG